MTKTNREELYQMLSKIFDLLMDTAIANNKNIHASFTVSVYVSVDDQDEVTIETNLEE